MTENKIDKFVESTVSEVAESRYVRRIGSMLVFLLKLTIVIGIAIGTVTVTGNYTYSYFTSEDQLITAAVVIITGLLALVISAKLIFK